MVIKLSPNKLFITQMTALEANHSLRENVVTAVRRKFVLMSLKCR